MTNVKTKQFALAVASLIAGLVILYLPSEIYLGNPLEFVSTPTRLIIDLLTYWLVFSLILAMPVLIPFHAWQRIWLTILCVLAFALWFTGVFLVPDFGSMDSASFDLGRHNKTLHVHTTLFIVAFIAVIFGMRKWPAFMMIGLAVIGAGMTIMTVNNFYTVSTVRNGTLESVDPGEIARFSSKKNVLILVLDTFQSDILQTMIDGDSPLLEALAGFRFFPDTLGVAPTSNLTMPAFHSGVIYDRVATLQHFYDQGIGKDSFLGELSRNGYQVDIVNPIVNMCPEDINICKQQKHLLLNSREVTQTEASRLADLGVLRAIPGHTKKLVLDGSSGIVSRATRNNPLTGLEHRIYNANTVLQIVADQISVDDGPPTARLIHLVNTRPPFMFDKECTFTGVVNTIDRNHQTAQTECAMRWFVYLLDAMKRTGVYDNSLIILTADAGAGSIQAEDDLSNLYAQEHGVAPGPTGRMMGGANPVLAIKLPNATGPMQTSTVQAQLTDIPRTVCETLGDCSNRRGLDLGKNQNIPRERTYHYYQFKDEYRSLDDIPEITQYSVFGPLWQEASWTKSLHDGKPQEIMRLNFSHSDDAGIYGIGWGSVENESETISKRWATASLAELILPLPTGKNLVFSFKAFRAPGLDQQEVTLRINGEVIASRSIEEGLVDVFVPVPGSLISTPETQVLLEFSSLKGPESNEERELAAAFYSLIVYQR
jgi:hypothetical protein